MRSTSISDRYFNVWEVHPANVSTTRCLVPDSLEFSGVEHKQRAAREDDGDVFAREELLAVGARGLEAAARGPRAGRVEPRLDARAPEQVAAAQRHQAVETAVRPRLHADHAAVVRCERRRVQVGARLRSSRCARRGL